MQGYLGLPICVSTVRRASSATHYRRVECQSFQTVMLCICNITIGRLVRGEAHGWERQQASPGGKKQMGQRPGGKTNGAAHPQTPLGGGTPTAPAEDRQA